jgi:hypothetical protein
MEKVVIDGVEYVKASELAKEFKYTSDYLGQLCRAKKVDARLVGRSWFVNPDSLREHKQNKYSSTKGGSSSKSNPESEDIAPTINRVKPVLKNKTAKSTFRERLESDGVSRNLRVAYQADEQDLLPTMNRHETPAPKTIRVKQFNAKKVKVKGDKKRDYREFVPEELPEVALRGGVKVEALEESVEEEESAQDSASDQTRERKVRIRPRKGTKIKLSRKQDNHKNKVEITKSREDNLDARTSPKKGQTVSMTRKTTELESQSVSHDNQVEFSPESVMEDRVQPVSISGWVATSPLIATVAAIAVSVLLFTISSDVQVGDGNFSTGLRLQLATLMDIFLP